MRISRQGGDGEREALRDDFARAAYASGSEGRVCGAACLMACPHCNSSACQCLCSPYCKGAASALSSDPVLHPIEPAILPLVFAMARIGLFAPCWSCEGHEGPDGGVMKLPTVWFYCGAVAHLRILADGLNALFHARRLNAPWRITVTFSDADNPRTTFALEPVQQSNQLATLPALQPDADEIARALDGIMRHGAIYLLVSTDGPSGR